MQGKAALVFAGVAEGLAPYIEQVFGTLKAIDWPKMANGAAEVSRALGGAFASGQLINLISESLGLALQSVVDMAPGIFSKLGYIILKAFETPLIYIQTSMDYILDQAVGKYHSLVNSVRRTFDVGFAMSEKLGTAKTTWKAQSFSELLAERRARGLEFDYGTGAYGLDEINDASTEALAAGAKRVQSLWADYLGKLRSYGGTLPGATASKLSGPGMGSVNFGGSGGFLKASAVTSFEQLGFISSLGRGFDVNQRISDNTERTAKGVEGLREDLREMSLDLSNA